MDVRRVVPIVFALAALGVAPAATGRSQPFAPAVVTIDANGTLSPVVVTFRAGALAPTWRNFDSSPHTVTFADGLCTLELEPGATDYCPRTFWVYVGTYRYTVTGTTPSAAAVHVTPARRSVTITASAAAVTTGSAVRLHGLLAIERWPAPLPPLAMTVDMRVVALTRAGRVLSTMRVRAACPEGYGPCPWALVVHPARDTRYEARAWSQPRGGTVWQRATSRVVRINVR